MMATGIKCSKHSEYIPRGLLLQWHVTNRCNLRCAHCYQDAAPNEELSLSELLGVLAQYVDLLRNWRLAARTRRVPGNVTITGGEPFLRPDIWTLLESLARRQDLFSFAILSNGSCLGPPEAERLRRLRPAFVQVSIEGGPDTHDIIRGAGDFDRVVRAIGLLTLAGIRTLISFTASRKNFREFSEVAQLGRRLGVARVWADRLIPAGRGAELRDALLTPAETREFFDIIRRSRSADRHGSSPATEIALHRALQFLSGGGEPYHCTAGDTLLAVLPNGDVYPCRRMPILIGNLQEKSLADLYSTSDVLRRLRNRRTISHGCEHCAYAKLCGGGLRCLSYAVCGNPFVADPGCWLAKQMSPLLRKSGPGHSWSPAACRSLNEGAPT